MLYGAEPSHSHDEADENGGTWSTSLWNGFSAFLLSSPRFTRPGAILKWGSSGTCRGWLVADILLKRSETSRSSGSRKCWNHSQWRRRMFWPSADGGDSVVLATVISRFAVASVPLRSLQRERWHLHSISCHLHAVRAGGMNAPPFLCGMRRSIEKDKWLKRIVSRSTVLSFSLGCAKISFRCFFFSSSVCQACAIS